MDIRIIGTEKEIETVKDLYRSLEKSDPSLIVIMSKAYPARGSDKLKRIYISVRSEK